MIKRAIENITKEHKYDIIDDYIFSGMTNEQIAEKYSTSRKNVQLIIERHTKALLNVRETKALLGTSPDTYKSFCTEVLDPSQVNAPFLAKLSEPDSPVLTDNEVIFCELYNYNGDEAKALEVSKLNEGLKRAKDPKDRSEYVQSMIIRAFYLKRKPNIAQYLQKIQKEKLQAIVEGKGFIQSELLALIEKLRNSEGERNYSNHLKAISELGRTLGAFEEKIVVENINADGAIDRILRKAQEAKARVIEQED